MPRNQRSKVVDQKITQLSPFSETGRYIVEEDGRFMIWLWDRANEQAAIKEALSSYSVLENHIRSLEPIPEPLLFARGYNDSVLVRCTVGRDQQVWNQRALVSSCWDYTSDVEDVDFLETPWVAQTDDCPLKNEPLLWRLGAAILVLLTVFQMGTSLGFLFKNSELAEQLTDARVQISTLAQIRGQVRQIRAQNSRLIASTGQLDQLAVLVEVDRLIPPSAAITEWIYLNGTLRIQLEDKGMDNRDYLERLATSNLFANAKIAPGADSQSAIVSLEVAR